MRLRYSLSRWDLFRAGLRATLHQRVLLIVFVPLLAFMAWSTFTYEENQKLALPMRVAVTMVSVAMGAGFGLLAGATFLAVQSFLRRDTGVLGEHILEITDEGLVESTNVNRSLSNWRTLFRIRETGRYVYIYISAGHAHIIPKGRPPLEGSVAEFLRELRVRIATSQEGVTPHSGLTTESGRSEVTKARPL